MIALARQFRRRQRLQSAHIDPRPTATPPRKSLRPSEALQTRLGLGLSTEPFLRVTKSFKIFSGVVFFRARKSSRVDNGWFAFIPSSASSGAAQFREKMNIPGDPRPAIRVQITSRGFFAMNQWRVF